MKTPIQSAALDQLVEEYRNRLVAALEMLTGESVVLEVLIAEENTARLGELFGNAGGGWVWNRYALSTEPPATVFTGASELASKAIGAKVLLAAGIEEMNDSDVNASYVEVQQSAISALAHWLSAQMGTDIAAGTPVLADSPPAAEECFLLSLQLDGSSLDPVCLAVPAPLREQLSRPPADSDAAPAAAPLPRQNPAATPAAQPVACDAGIERILDFELPLRVSFGKARLPLRDVLKLTTGSIVEIDLSISDQVEIVVNQRVVGRGEVVVVDGNYGIRIQEITAGSG